jgi:HAMP domain-containing protein
MKIGTKLIAGFLIIALVLVGVVGITFVVGQEFTTAVEDLEEVNSELQDINELSTECYEEYSLGLKYLAEENETSARALRDELVSDDHEHDETVDELIEAFSDKGADCEVHLEISEALTDIKDSMDEIDETFDDLIEKKNGGLLGDALWVSELSMLDESFNDIMYGEGLDDTEGFDYVVENLSENAVIVSDYRDNTMAFFESWAMLKDIIATQYQLAIQALLSENQTEIGMANGQIAGYNQMKTGIIMGISSQLSGTEGLEEQEELKPFFDAVNSVFYDISLFDVMIDTNITLKLTGQLNDVEPILVNLTNLVYKIGFGPSPTDMEGLDYLIMASRDKGIECVIYASANDAELEQIHYLVQNLSIEYTLAIKYIVTENPAEAAEIFEERKKLSDSNSANIDGLITSFKQRDWVTFNPGVDDAGVHAHIAIRLESIQTSMEDMDDILNDIKNLKESSALNYTEALQKLDGLITDIMTGDGPDDNDGFDFIVSSLNGEIEEAKEKRRAAESTIMTGYLIAIIIGVVIAVLMGVALSKSMTSRLTEITEGAEKIKMGDLDVSIKESMNDEITILSKAFNQMILSVRLLTGVDEVDIQKKK